MLFMIGIGEGFEELLVALAGCFCGCRPLCKRFRPVLDGMTECGLLLGLCMRRFQRPLAGMVMVNCARTLSRRRWTVWAISPTVLAQPKGSSIFFRRRWDRA